MKLITAVISVAIIVGANAKSSKASAKASKSKSSKARCIDTSSLSFSVSSKSGKTLSSSSKSGKAQLSLSLSSKLDEDDDGKGCVPCAFGEGILGTTLCGTKVGFCEFSVRDDLTVDSCDANDCVPACFSIEPICDQCALASIIGANCPQSEGVCEFTVSADAEPSCVVSDCVIPEGGARRLEMGKKEWIFGGNDVFQW